jgi:hypothetical protein
VELPGRLGAVTRRVGIAVEGIAQDVADAVVPVAVDAVDLNEVLERVDVNALLEKLDLDRLLERVDLDALIARVDLNAVLDRVDPNRLVARVDIDQVLQRVDINEVAKRVDVDALVARSDLETIVARSTSGLASEGVDTLRSQGVGLDSFVHRWIDRLLGRQGDRPVGPASLVAPPPTGDAAL